jgi:hypothetical protein
MKIILIILGIIFVIITILYIFANEIRKYIKRD